MKWAGKIFISGLLALIPIFATLYLLHWTFTTAEAFFTSLLSWLLPSNLQMPGMGLLVAIGIIFGFGLLLNTRHTRRLILRVERAVLSIPLVNSLYSAIRDFMRLFADSGQDGTLQVVAVTLPGTRMRVLGFITRGDFTGLPAGIAADGDVAVYLPMSYQVGGYTVFMPRDQLEAIDMPKEAAMRFVLTAGVNVSTLNRGGPPRGKGGDAPRV
ncbi:MAG: DUF502 domain-containing protein [Zoogloeaceae bacterium]|nr:DUF502 domain-containing protein [Zoogloeaceae bacterium]